MDTKPDIKNDINKLPSKCKQNFLYFLIITHYIILLSSAIISFLLTNYKANEIFYIIVGVLNVINIGVVSLKQKIKN